MKECKYTKKEWNGKIINDDLDLSSSDNESDNELDNESDNGSDSESDDSFVED